MTLRERLARWLFPPINAVVEEELFEKGFQSGVKSGEAIAKRIPEPEPELPVAPEPATFVAPVDPIKPEYEAQIVATWSHYPQAASLVRTRVRALSKDPKVSPDQIRQAIEGTVIEIQ